MTDKKTKRNIPFKEWVWYLIASLLIGWGLAEIICGLILDYATGSVTQWPLYQANQKYTELFGLNFLYWGLILLAIGVIVGVIVLCVFAATYDREAEKQSRRAARLHGKNKKEEPEVVEAKVSEPVAEEKPAEEVKEEKPNEEPAKEEPAKAEEPTEAKKTEE